MTQEEWNLEGHALLMAGCTIGYRAIEAKGNKLIVYHYAMEDPKSGVRFNRPDWHRLPDGRWEQRL